ncbi:HD-GYP domain-containing protein [Clostridium uliginosum]|uniref:HD domain-containing protein n=1 Tax=Clostridium uliginosum TaxID=119641 RepID=A0A1I1L3F2_9CLOT|nr:HD-GYP domain-containing protein [Clostridium uliginosum]SFC67475.1 HD domain-containing protein [Clostridium uliginosum]
MRLIPIEYVKPNTILGKTLYTIDGRMLVKSGMVLTKRMIAKIKEINVLSLYIVDEYSSDEIVDIIKPELRQKAILTIKDAFFNINKITIADKFSKKSEVYFKNIQTMSEELMENILTNEDVLLSLVDIRSMDNYIYSHSVNVAIISMILGIALKLPKKKLEYLCMGALIHDIGKSFVPKKVLMTEEELTPEENILLEQHPRLGYNYLSDSYNLSANSKSVALQHHERPDGLGYPDGLCGDKISIFSKIVSIADAYDTLSSGRPNKRAMFPSDVLEYLMSNAGKMFDYDIVNTFCKVVVPFSNGTLVNLSNGDIAIVKETLPNFPLRPIVEILKSSKTNTIGEEINLIEELSIVITNIRYEM